VPATVGGSQQVIVRTRYTPHGELREGRFGQLVEQVA